MARWPRRKPSSSARPTKPIADLRDRINAGQTRFFDIHLSLLPQVTRYGFLGTVDIGRGRGR